MTFRLDPDRPVRKEVRRVALEQLEDARLATAVGDVHAARKALKRVRAVHRLTGAKRKGDRLLRDAGRLLAGARDAEVLVELFDRLAPHLDASVEDVERARHELRADVEAAAVDEAGAVALLDRAAKRVKRWDVDDVEPGVRATYREARRAMRGSESAPTGRRKIHQRTPLSTSDARFTTAAAIRTVRLASLMLSQVVAQLTFRANNTSATMMIAESPSRSSREAAFCMRS